MSNKPTVSVIIPAFNESSHIGRCLDALGQQTHAPLEIIVVDNNSTDTTADIARSYPGVRVISEPQQGIAFARNTGFSAASGDIIARLDADTIPSPDWLEAIAARFDQDSTLGGLGGPSAPKELLFLGTHIAAKVYGLFRTWHEKSIGVSPMLYGCNTAIRHEAWQHIASQTSPGDKQIAEDVEVTILLNKAGFHVGYEPRMMIKFAWVRGLNPKKLHSYYQHDNFTLAKHDYGSKKRRNR